MDKIKLDKVLEQLKHDEDFMDKYKSIKSNTKKINRIDTKHKLLEIVKNSIPLVSFVSMLDLNNRCGMLEQEPISTICFSAFVAIAGGGYLSSLVSKMENQMRISDSKKVEEYIEQSSGVKKELLEKIRSSYLQTSSGESVEQNETETEFDLDTRKTESDMFGNNVNLQEILNGDYSSLEKTDEFEDESSEIDNNNLETYLHESEIIEMEN